MVTVVAAIVGFVVGIALAIVVDEVLGFQSGLWDAIGVLIGLGGAVLAVRLVHRGRGPQRRRPA